jgi:hypothetical protein
MSNTTDSSDNSDNSAIKNKKGPAPITMKESSSFLLTLLGKLFVLGIVVVVGTCLVYTCRVAQSNILPTDMNFTPYTDVIPTIVGGDKIVNIDIVKTAEGIFSTKLIFPLAENIDDLRNKGFIGYLNKLKDPKADNSFYLYIATTIQQILANNLAIINWVYGSIINNFFNESMIIFLAPFLSIFVNFCTSIINGFYFAFLLFYNLPLFFSTTTSDKTAWASNSMWSFMNWWKTLIVVWVAILVFLFVGIGIIVPAVATLSTIFCTLLPLFMKAEKVDGDGVGAGAGATKSSYSIKDALKNVLKYKMSLIMYIISFFVIVDANASFGGYEAFIAIIACLLLYFFTNVYKQYIPADATGWTNDFTQATKLSQADALAEDFDQAIKTAALKKEQEVAAQEKELEQKKNDEIALADNKERQSEGLPKGWEQKVTADGKIVYVDHNTGTTQWEKPIMGGKRIPRKNTSRKNIAKILIVEQ